MSSSAKTRSSFGLFLFALTTSVALGQIERTPPRIQKIIHKDCKATDTCDLKSFEVKTSDYKITIPDPRGPLEQFGTKMVANYETTNKKSLEKYGIVQFMQGCQYLSRKVDGVITNYPVIKREFMGKTIPFFSKEMEIDGFTYDPLYRGAVPKELRHFYYLSIDPTVDYSGKDYYGVRGPVSNKLYMIDHPGIAGYYPDSGRAYNISLKFKICLYKSEDVPREVLDRTSQDFAKPLHCLEWASSHVYNYEKNKFESLPEIAPYCNEFEEETI